MKLATTTPQKALKAFKNQRPARAEIDKFKRNLITLLDKINLIEARPKQESEEHLKNDVRDFLRDTYYIDSHGINTKDKKDLVIHLGKSVDTEVGVIIEAKRPSNKNEMVTADNANKKAFHELVLYYLNERVVQNNHSIKQLVITNIHQWYIIDANYFDKNIYQNKKIKAEFDKKLNDGKDNPYFYERIERILAEMALEIECIYFDFRNINKVLRDNDAENDKELIALYKILSPQHLLKEAKPNDSNSLDTNFYKELLHIIGLEEVKEGSKNIIRRKIDKIQAGSLIEATISQIEINDNLHHLPDLSVYGATQPERHFNIALELCITWINRILFLKLLEGQLVSYHGKKEEFSFLNIKKISDFDELFKLFHYVLAVKVNERKPGIQKEFQNVPYLNSSLFEISELEKEIVKINEINDKLKLDFHPTTILKDLKKSKTSLPTIEYIFEFLEAYDFASEVKDDFQNDKTIISASVLGKVFEKINGYKDGSIYTPAFITMYMCKQSIRLAVLDKFNEALSEPDQKRFDEFGDIINYFNKNDKKTNIKQGNEIINSLKICDPAVGSGHFLVSALNEIISIKADLGILADENQQTFGKYELEIANDELIITDRQGNDLNYKIVNGKPDIEIQRLQKALFHEKEAIIENCLFGVDINPNSVKICRLRLWIELLKNAYYKPISSPSGGGWEGAELETLPNIDINIKCGNSLLSRFALDADLKQALKSIKYNINEYRGFVKDYKTEKNREVKKGLQVIIDGIKADFRTKISSNDPKFKKLQSLQYEFNLLVAPNIFMVQEDPMVYGKDKNNAKKAKERIDNLETEINKLSKEISDIKDNAIYRNAFEWRFEFPEVLNDLGDFVGFDVVIGNPPYVSLSKYPELKVFQNIYKTYSRSSDLYVFFVEKGLSLIKAGGEFSYIIPNKWMQSSYGSFMRKLLLENQISSIIDFGDLQVFEGVTTYPCILSATNQKKVKVFDSAVVNTLNFEGEFGAFIKNKIQKIDSTDLTQESWLISSNQEQELLAKLKHNNQTLFGYLNGQAHYGIKTGLTEAFLINNETKIRLVNEDENSLKLIKPFLQGRNIKPYASPEIESWLILIPKGFTIKNNLGDSDSFDDIPNMVMESPPRYGDMPLNNAWKWFKESYPAIANYLLPFKEKAEKRSDKGDYWWELRACDYYDKFEKPKIMYQVLQVKPCFIYDVTGKYCNNSMWIIPNDDKFLLGILNSKLGWWLISKYCTGIQNGFQLIWSYFGQIPIKQISTDAQKLFITLVDQIITQKQQNQDTAALEKEIDKLVYQLYELTDEEIKIVEGN